MMLFGILILWTGLIWIFHDLFIHLFQKVQSKDQNRLSSLRTRLHQNFVFQEGKSMKFKAYWILFIGLLSSLFFQSLGLMLATLLFYLSFPTIWIRYVEFSRRNKFQQQLLSMIPLLSSMLKSGHGLEKSLAEVKNSVSPPMSEEIHFMLKEMQLGSSLEDSLQKMVSRFHSENLLTFSQAIFISRKLGTSLAEAMDHISENILEKEKLKQQIHALTSQGKLQAYMAVSMPFLIGLALKFISPGYFEPLFHTHIGKISLTYAALSLLIGLVWIYQITNKEYL